jgi:phosphoglycolate phosphatase
VPFRLAIFDFDGTLADSAGWFRGALNEAAPMFKFAPLADPEFERLRGLDHKAIMAHLRVPAWKVPLISRHLRRVATRDCHLIALFPGVEETLLRLAGAGVRIAIVSSNTEENVRRVLGPRLAGVVAIFACGVSLFGKAAKFKTVVKRSGIEPEAVLCIGDETRDIDAARTAGLLSAAVSWGYATQDVLRAREPDLLFEAVTEIAVAFGLPERSRRRG